MSTTAQMLTQDIVNLVKQTMLKSVKTQTAEGKDRYVTIDFIELDEYKHLY